MFGRGAAEKAQQYEARLSDLKAHILDLQCQIENLNKLVFPKNATLDIPLVQIEADAIISGHQEAVDLTEEEKRQIEEIDSEAAQLLSGTY